jgi:hypothetical protein
MNIVCLGADGAAGRLLVNRDATGAVWRLPVCEGAGRRAVWRTRSALVWVRVFRSAS